LLVDLRHLRYFVAVADAGGFSKAAVRLRVSQPALWRQVRQLEQDLGVRLFDRVGRRVRVTGQGEDLLAQGRDLLARAESLGERARAAGAGHTGVLRLGATPQMLESLATFLARWSRSSSGVSLHRAGSRGSRDRRRAVHRPLRARSRAPGPDPARGHVAGPLGGRKLGSPPVSRTIRGAFRRLAGRIHRASRRAGVWPGASDPFASGSPGLARHRPVRCATRGATRSSCRSDTT
jgi:DNA-binding transcriptional LysR family regulator